MRSLLILCLVISSFAKLSAQTLNRKLFANVLDLRTTVTDVKNIEKNLFSDKGAWHAYALPERKEDYGSFIGPVVMDLDGQWLANTVSKIKMEDGDNVIDLGKANVVQDYYPGLLEQSFTFNDIEVKQQLIFVSGREAMIQTLIYNHSKKQKNLTVSFT